MEILFPITYVSACIFLLVLAVIITVRKKPVEIPNVWYWAVWVVKYVVMKLRTN